MQIDDLIRVLSHQLKSPINSIESLLNVIADGFTGTADARTLFFIEKALKKSREARALISDIIQYETYTSAQNTPMELLDIVNIVSNTCHNYQTIAAEKNIILSVDIPMHTLIMLHGNSTGLELVFKNLIENAVKYTEENGFVKVSIREDTEHQTCVISVTDTGPGIDNEELDAVFTPFFRTRRHKLKVAGTGLGLAIVKRVLDKHQGSITVTSEWNVGSTFRVVLPYAELKTIDKKTVFKKRVVIIGGVTAGPKAAARLRRLDEELDITIIEKGELLSYSGCGLPAYISGKVTSPKMLMTTADNTLRDIWFFESIKNINILHKTEALKINRKAKTVLVKDLNSDKTRLIEYDVLILATGAQPCFPALPGIRQKGIYSLYSIDEAEIIKR